MLDDGGVMPGGNVLNSKRLGLMDKLFKFQFLIAQRAGNRRPRLHILGDEIVNDFFLKFFFHVEDVLGYSNPLCHPSGIGQIIKRTASAEPVI